MVNLSVPFFWLPREVPPGPDGDAPALLGRVAGIHERGVHGGIPGELAPALQAGEGIAADRSAGLDLNGLKPAAVLQDQVDLPVGFRSVEAALRGIMG